MKIAVLGSAPSSILKAPFGDPSWEIWACSPGAYPHLSRVDEFFEIHRWEPGVIGKPNTQRPWFSPEYVAWMKMQKRIWVSDPDALKDCPNAVEIPWRELVTRYGHYCWTSSIAYMLAMAIDKISAARAARAPEVVEDDVIGLWGVDMAANEELYSGQRSACQWFMQVLVGLKIGFYVPPESDLLTPPPMYGVGEIAHRHIKWLERKNELVARKAQADAQAEAMRSSAFFLQGAIDDMDYMLKMWNFEGDSLSFDFSKFGFPAPAAMPAPAAAAPPGEISATQPS